MTKKISIKGYVHSELNWDKKIVYSIESGDYSKYGSRSLVCELDLELDIPGNFDPIAAEVARLKQAIVKTEEQTAAAIFSLKQQINDLAMLEYTV